MTTLIELAGHKIGVIEYYLESMSETLNGKKGDELIPCRNRIKKVIIVNYTTGERMIIEASDITKIADEIRLTTRDVKQVPLHEII